MLLSSADVTIVLYMLTIVDDDREVISLCCLMAVMRIHE
jgi:hypothetical protein